MAEKSQTKKSCSLYKLALSAFVNKLSNNVVSHEVQNLKFLPPIILADVYSNMSSIERLIYTVGEELSDVNTLMKLLQIGAARQKIFQCFSYLMSFGLQIATSIVDGCKSKFCSIETLPEKEKHLELIDGCLQIGSFLSELGMLEESIMVLTATLRHADLLEQDYMTLLLKIDCLQRLLHAQAGFCCFKDSRKTVMQAEQIINKIGVDNIPASLLSSWYLRVAVLYYGKSEYDPSYAWSIKALKLLTEKTPPKIQVDVLRHAAKSCVVKRFYERANLLISYAVTIARRTFGKYHQKYSDALLDYGFFLLNVDFIDYSVEMYKEALKIRQSLFSVHNLHIAIALEDLSYALYVHEYSSGRFQKAQDYIEQAIDILRQLVPINHLILASAKRVKALILEEVALDNMGPDNANYIDLLHESESLHQSALQLSLEAFGERNVQTAKHYGNLGRLYQSMMQFEEAEMMHKRAIRIKSDLLGPYDYEVGLSIGHLASLYNYHMKKHREAEKLYHESIAISLRLFGPSYSGLEYDYRGLCHVYETTNEPEKYIEYAHLLNSWRIRRDEGIDINKTNFDSHSEESTLEDVTKQFFEIDDYGGDVVVNLFCK